MASSRMIDSDIWEDDFFTPLSMMGRLLWMGLITRCADDQGRLQDNPKLIRAKLFPMDECSLGDIEQELDKFARDGKITRYCVDGKCLIQIVNWWKHQRPRWAYKSKYPPPPKWVDRVRYHGEGNVISEANWKVRGGYIADSTGAYTIRDVKGEDDIKDDVKGEDDDDVDVAAAPPSSSSPSPNIDIDSELAELGETFTKVTNISYDSLGAAETKEHLVEMWNADVYPDDITKAVEELVAKNWKIVSLKSIVKPAINCAHARFSADAVRESKNSRWITDPP